MLKLIVSRYDKILKDIVDNSQKKLADDLISLYSYGSVNYGNLYLKDIDLMYILRTVDNHVDPKNLDTVKNICKPYDNPQIDYYVYGEDEIPSGKNIGYSLFSSLFLLDYKSHARLLYGKDVLREIPDIEFRIKSIELSNMFRRALRHAILDQKNNPKSLRIFMGDWAGENVYMTQSPLASIEDPLIWCSYCATMTAKSMLSFYGVHITNKHDIPKTFLKKFGNTREAALFKDVLVSTKNLEKSATVEDRRHVLEKTLRFIESVSARLEENYA